MTDKDLLSLEGSIGVNPEEKIKDWVEKCAMPYRYQKENFGTFKTAWQPKAFSVCKAFAEDFNLDKIHSQATLALLSPTVWGNGKTHLAAAIAHRIFQRYADSIEYCPIRWVSEPVLFRQIRDTYGGGFIKEADIIKPLIGARLLIIDDIGKEEVKDPIFVQRTLFAIFDARYNAELPLVFTSNLSVDGLKFYLGGNRGNEASFNRLAEAANFVIMAGKSYRTRGDR